MRTRNPDARVESLTGYLRPLEDFTQLHTALVRSAGSRLIDLSFPNPRTHRDGRAHEILRKIAIEVDPDALQYTPFGGATLVRRQIAQRLGRLTGLRFGYRDIVMTPGATAALCVTMSVFFTPGDEVILVTPCWMDYPLYLERLGVTVRFVPSTSDKRLDLPAIEEALGPRTAGVVISQPACPTGVLATEQEMAALGAVLHAARRFGHAPILISDEVHRDQVWAEAGFVSPMRFYPETVSVYSFGKAWSMQGQRTGYLAVSPHLSDRASVLPDAERAMRASGHCAPTALMQLVAAQLSGLTPDAARLADDQRYVRSRLARCGFPVVAGQGTSFVYAKCPDDDDIAFVTALAARGVLAMPSSIFYEPGYFRLALNVDRERLGEAVDRIAST